MTTPSFPSVSALRGPHIARDPLLASCLLLPAAGMAVAFTNNPFIVFGPPDFSQAAIEVGTHPKKVMITLKY